LGFFRSLVSGRGIVIRRRTALRRERTRVDGERSDERDRIDRFATIFGFDLAHGLHAVRLADRQARPGPGGARRDLDVEVARDFAGRGEARTRGARTKRRKKLRFLVASDRSVILEAQGFLRGVAERDARQGNQGRGRGGSDDGGKSHLSGYIRLRGAPRTRAVRFWDRLARSRY
jgi:hypothetical protein